MGQINNSEPDKILKATMQYRKRNDPYQQFVEECMVKDQDLSSLSFVDMNEIYHLYITWYKDAYQTSKNSNSKGDIKEEFAKKLGSLEDGTRWYGWKLKKNVNFAAQVEEPTEEE